VKFTTRHADFASLNTAQGEGVSPASLKRAEAVRAPGVENSDLGVTCGAAVGPRRPIALRNGEPTGRWAGASDVEREAPGPADEMTAAKSGLRRKVLSKVS
jgi:hypothetical protein